MSRLIDADALMEAINTWPKFGVDERCRIVPWSERYEPYIHLRDAVIAITGMPTIEERKTGKWIDCNNSGHWKCSECGDRAPMYWDANWKEYDEWFSSFCPNCGADMRGEEHG